jgi:hypothetical protein
MSVRHLVVLVNLVLLGAPSAARGAVTAWTDVVVRVYDMNGVISGMNATALDDARKTLTAASIDVIWRLCAKPPVCDAPLAPGELALRIVRSPGPRRYQGRLPLGDAMVDARRANGVLATVYSDRVEWLAREAGANPRTLLGRAIAHELGHLLLATTSHGPVGLMRGLWTQDEVRRGLARDWDFAPTELAAMRRRVEASRVEASQREASQREASQHEARLARGIR